jgi:hypothetical protein
MNINMLCYSRQIASSPSEIHHPSAGQHNTNALSPQNNGSLNQAASAEK